jgi:hypothetical protein
MFDRLRTLLTRRGEAPPLAAGPHTPLDRWARSAGLQLQDHERTADFTLSGQLEGKPLRLERTAPSRPYIVGAELRARVVLDTAPEVFVLVINRTLRDALEHGAYVHYTDGVRTALDANMPEELRWLAMLDEVGWDRGAVPAFWPRYAVVASAREHAQAWLRAELMQALLDWPQAAGEGPAFMLRLQQGKLYLRMAFAPAGLPMLQHVMQLLALASAAALAGCPKPAGA